MKYFNSVLKKIASQIIGIANFEEPLKQSLRAPLYENSLYLIASSGISSVLGFIFWIVVARSYDPANVGLAAALITAVSLIAMLSTLGLGTGLIRFLPSAGNSSISMINSSLTLGGLGALVISAIFLAGLTLWSPTLTLIRDNPVYIATFLLFSVAWTLSLVMDRILVAKRAARFTFFKNATANILKIPITIVLVTLGFFGIFISVGLTVAASVILALFWFLPLVQRGYVPLPAISKNSLKGIIRYSLVSHAASMLANLPAMLLPLMVVNVLGAESNAYFYIAWSIMIVILLIPSAISSSLLAETSHFEELLLTNTRSMIKLGLVILVPVVGLTMVLASKVLLLFGEVYSLKATIVVQVLAVAAFPYLINSIYITVNQVQKKMRMVVTIAAVIACLCLSASYSLMLKFGLVGAALGFTVGQSIVAIAAVWHLLQQREQKILGNS